MYIEINFINQKETTHDKLKPLHTGKSLQMTPPRLYKKKKKKNTKTLPQQNIDHNKRQGTTQYAQHLQNQNPKHFHYTIMTPSIFISHVMQPHVATIPNTTKFHNGILLRPCPGGPLPTCYFSHYPKTFTQPPPLPPLWANQYEGWPC